MLVGVEAEKHVKSQTSVQYLQKCSLIQGSELSMYVYVWKNKQQQQHCIVFTLTAV